MAYEAMPQQMSGIEDAADLSTGRMGAVALSAAEFSVVVTHSLDEVEPAWRQLEAVGVDSPGQSYDFIKLWVEALGIAEQDQFYLLAWEAGRPIALLPLRRRNRFGVKVLTWFPGSHVGCTGPIIDAARLAALGPLGRKQLWQTVAEAAGEADVMSLSAMPSEVQGIPGLYAELGDSLVCDTLYRAQFSGWEECNTTQRSKSRRKHDRQQGEKLDALGMVSFEELSSGEEAGEVLELMFRQRAARFIEMGVKDPFASCAVKSFYRGTVKPGSSVPVKLHVLRLNGEIVAVRYNIVHGDRLFCLISSMSADPAIQVGSPGKQCLLRVMQTVFDQGYSVFDMGAGLTDEKRHWCNRQIELRQHYVSLTLKGRAAVAGHRMLQSIRARIKADASLFSKIKLMRSHAARVRPKASEDTSE